MKQKKILHVIRQDHGGSAVVVDLIAKNLNKTKYEAIIYLEKLNCKRHKRILSEEIINQKTKNVIRYVTAKQDGKNHEGIHLGVKIESTFGKNASIVYFSMKMAYEFIIKQAPKISNFIKIIRNNKISLVHTHCDLTRGKPEIIAAKITGIPCISHIHAYYTLTHFDKFFKKFVDKFVCVSNDVANEYNKNLCTGNKTVMIHNGLDMALHKNNYDNERIRKEIGVKTEDFLVCLIGRIVAWKGHEYFIKAIAKIANKYPKIIGIIVGDIGYDYYSIQESYYRKLILLIKELKINEKIIFTGFRSDVPRLISAMDIIVHASSSPEPFGLVVIEGMASGKPVIATAKGGVLDIIEDGVNGILIPCKDTDSMAKAILKIYHDKKMAKKIGVEARKRIIKKFTIEHQVAAVEKLYDSLLCMR